MAGDGLNVFFNAGIKKHLEFFLHLWHNLIKGNKGCDFMDIAAVSMAMSSMSIQQSASIGVLKQVMNAEEAITDIMIESLAELSVGCAPAGMDICI